jgi:hypothetical protein
MVDGSSLRTQKNKTNDRWFVRFTDDGCTTSDTEIREIIINKEPYALPYVVSDTQYAL